MKKLLSVVLMIVLCIGCLCSCDALDSLTGMFPLPGQEAEKPVDEGIDAAAAVIEALVTQDKAEPERTASFDVPTTVKLSADGVAYTVEWSVDDSRIAITDGRKEGYKTIVIPEVNETEFTFVLTAFITGGGHEYTLDMRIKCPVKKDIGAASNIETGKAYLLAMEQSQMTEKPTYYATGAMFKYWFALTEGAANGVNFYFEETTGGYHMYAKFGETKNYVNVIAVEKNSVININCVYEAAPTSVWVWDDALNTIVTTLADETYFLGAKNTNKNLTPLATSETEKISVGKIVASNNADKSSFYVPSVDGAVKPEAGNKYSLAINLDFGNIYYTTGAEGSKPYYLLVNKDITKAANFYLEETEGGFHIYGIINGAKKYLNIRANGDHVNSLYEDSANGVWVWNADLGIFTVTVNETLYTLGSEGYDNLSALTLAEASYRVAFVASTNDDQQATQVETSTIAQALAATDDDIVKIEGVIVAIEGTNAYVVKDSTGSIYIYQSAGELVVGDKVSVQGTKDTYYGFHQLKSVTATKIDTATVEHGTATFYTGTDLATYKAGSSIAADYISFQGTLNKSGNYYNVTFADTTAITGSLKVSADLTAAVDALNNKMIVVKGYFGGTSGTGGKYVNLIVTEIELYVCEHTYNTLPNKCDNCGEITDHTCTDGNSDNACDLCGEAIVIPTLSITEALAYTAADPNAIQYLVTGTIDQITNTQYGNVWINDGNGNRILVYGLADENNNRYDAMTVKPVVGDTITILCTVGYYGSAPQLAGAVVKEHIAHNHTYDALPNKCDICGGITAHECAYTDVCDADCNLCGTTRTAPHAPQYPCSTSCQICSTPVTAGEHVDEAGDGVCDNCGGTISAVVTATETLSFASKDNRTAFSTTEQTWVSGGITFVNTKADSTNDVADYANPVRLYKGSTVTISATGMTKIVIEANSTSYATAAQTSLTTAGIACTVEGKVITITLTGVNSITFTCSAQIRFNSVTVTYTAD